MHSFLVALTYMAMVFAPCAVAQWGDVLMLPMNFRFGRVGRRRKAQRWSFANFAIDQDFAGCELAELTSYAFVPPAPLPAYAKAKTFAEVPVVANSRSANFEQAAARVAARLQQMVEAHKLVNTGVMAESAEDAVVAARFAAVPRFTAEAFAQPAVRRVAEQADAARRVDTGPHMYLLPPMLWEDGALAETPPEALAA